MWQTVAVAVIVALAGAYVVWRLRRTVTRRQTSCCDAGEEGRCPLQTNSGAEVKPSIPGDDACAQCRSRPDRSGQS